MSFLNRILLKITNLNIVVFLIAQWDRGRFLAVRVTKVWRLENSMEPRPKDTAYTTKTLKIIIAERKDVKNF